MTPEPQLETARRILGQAEAALHNYEQEHGLDDVAGGLRRSVQTWRSVVGQLEQQAATGTPSPEARVRAAYSPDRSRRKIAELAGVPFYLVRKVTTELGLQTRVARIGWEDVDWSKSSRQIARELGCAESYVSIQRRALNPGTVRGKRSDAEQAALDWRKTDAQLAAETGATLSSVGRWRRRHAPETSAQGASKKAWKEVDWSRGDEEIARTLGLRVKYVMKKRLELAPPGETNEGRERLRWAGVDWSKPTRDIARELGLTSEYVSKRRRTLAPHTLRDGPRKRNP